MGFSARKDTAVGNFLVEILSFKYIRNRCIHYFEIIIVSKSTVLTEKQQALVIRNEKRLEAIKNLEINQNQQINSTETIEGEL